MERKDGMKNKKKMRGLLTVMFIFAMMLGATSVSAATKVVNLSPNRWYVDSSRDTSQTVYHKIKIPKAGYIAFSGHGYLPNYNGRFSMSLQMCNSKKKQIQSEPIYLSSSNDFRNYVAVKKGTYLVKVKDFHYKLRYSFKAVTEKSGTSRSKARNIARNKTVWGLLLMGENGAKTDWYKFTLPSDRRVTFSFGARANSGVELELVPADKNIRITDNRGYLINTTRTWTTPSVIPRGTYYLKIKRLSGDKNITGAYSLKWR